MAIQAGWLTFHVLALVFTFQAHGYESRLQQDPRADLAKLERSGRIKITTDREKSVYISDASAVLAVDPERLFQVSLDYNRYREMKMPHVRQSRLVEKAGDHLYIWTHMSVSIVSSRHYLEVRVHPRLDSNEARGMEWQLHRPSASAGWSYPDAPAFSRIDGSWYIKPLGRKANGEELVYVRYYLVADVNAPFPDGLISGIVQKQLADGVRGVIQTLARHARLRHQ